MKKKLLISFVIISGLFISCSQDESLISNKASEKMARVGNNSPSIEDSIDKEFYDYIHSDDYKDYLQKNNAFLDKLNYKGDLSLLKTKSAMLSWIKINIQQTKFLNITEAENEYLVCVDMQKKIEHKFYQVYDFIYKGDISLVKIKLTKWFVNDYINLSEDDNCKKSFSQCTDAAASSYANEYKLVKESGMDSSELANEKWTLQTTFNNQMGACRETFDKCIGL